MQVSLDGVVVATAAVGPGTGRIPFATTRAHQLRLTVLARNAAGRPVRISEIGIGGDVATFSAQAAARACVTVATIDGQPLRMHPLQPVLGLDPQLYGSCPGAAQVDLGGGHHQLRSDGAWVADSLVLRDHLGERVVAPGPVPALESGPATARR